MPLADLQGPTWVIGDAVDAENVKAAFKNGVLAVILAKKLEARRQVKRIEIT